MKLIKKVLSSDVIVYFDKKENLKKVVSPFDSDKIINSKIK